MVGELYYEYRSYVSLWSFVIKWVSYLQTSALGSMDDQGLNSIFAHRHGEGMFLMPLDRDGDEKRLHDCEGPLGKSAWNPWLS